MKLVDELEALHEAARGCEFDLRPTDGPIAKLALFMHENGESITAALRASDLAGGATQGREEALEEGAKVTQLFPAKLTPPLRRILGLMCFQLAAPAHAYQSAGEFEGSEGPLDERAEDEQAFMLHKLLGYWFVHGADWAEFAQADLNRVCDAIERGEHRKAAS